MPLYLFDKRALTSVEDDYEVWLHAADMLTCAVAAIAVLITKLSPDHSAGSRHLR